MAVVPPIGPVGPLTPGWPTCPRGLVAPVFPPLGFFLVVHVVRQVPEVRVVRGCPVALALPWLRAYASVNCDINC
jgi:hypothetical protein